jgi:hypothetical protein
VLKYNKYIGYFIIFFITCQQKYIYLLAYFMIIVCNAGSYGHNCVEKCSENCAGGQENCDPISGRCRLGCKAGWIGQLCDRG